jgi:hypothetical protein
MANSYLTRTLGTSTNAYKGTVSHWIKRSGLGSMGTFAAWDNGGTASNRAYLNLYNDSLYFYDQPTSTVVQTNRLLRDTSAWYHIVVGWDTSQATASDRVKIYVNGVQETSMATGNYPSQNSTLQFNTSGRTFSVGSYASSGSAAGFFNGYQSHFAFVDGQQLTPTSFGLTDSTSGIWKFKPPSGVTWGTNGVHLKFENSGALGTDSSGNTNTFTVNGNLKQALDTPSNVYATWNPLHYGTFVAGSTTMTNGNLTFTSNETGSNYPIRYSTLAVSTGKWYAEFKVTSPVGLTIGISDGLPNNYIAHTNSQECGYYYDGRRFGFSNQSHEPWGNSFTTNDIIGVAMDLDNNKLYFSKNGSYQESGDPTNGTNGITIPTSATGVYHFAFGDRNTTGQPGVSANFGNGFFGTTAITSAGSNGNGSLFEYDVPSGYYALNTKNINTYG